MDPFLPFRRSDGPHLDLDPHGVGCWSLSLRLSESLHCLWGALQSSKWCLLPDETRNLNLSLACPERSWGGLDVW